MGRRGLISLEITMQQGKLSSVRVEVGGSFVTLIIMLVGLLIPTLNPAARHATTLVMGHVVKFFK